MLHLEQNFEDPLQGRIQDLKKGSAKGTGAKCLGKFWGSMPTFGHANALVVVVKCNLAFARTQTILYYRRTFASRNNAAGSAVLRLIIL